MKSFSFSAQHLSGISSLNLNEIHFLLSAAQRLQTALKENRVPKLLIDQTCVLLFTENSTRTRTSFEVAIRKLGGTSLNFSASLSSLKKGETLLDTALNIAAMNPQGLIVRHSSAGSPEFLSRHLSIPVLNAGDGFREHPTQALTDAYTIQQKLHSLQGKKVLILGDIAHSRVARSNISLLKRLGASVAVCAPPTLMPPSPESLGIESSYHPETFLAQADVVMCLRIQFERQNKMQIPSTSEYIRFWGLTQERARLLKPEAIIMHPGPVNRGVEIDAEVADGKHSVILDQVANGIAVRMAVLSSFMSFSKLKQWYETTS